MTMSDFHSAVQISLPAKFAIVFSCQRRNANIAVIGCHSKKRLIVNSFSRLLLQKVRIQFSPFFEDASHPIGALQHQHASIQFWKTRGNIGTWTALMPICIYIFLVGRRAIELIQESEQFWHWF